MHIAAHLDMDVVALEEADTLTVLLELTAPTPSTERTRPPAVVEVVLDRSGSMAGAPLEAARDALLALVDRLEPTDAFGLVCFDHAVDVVVPAGPLTDKAAVRAAIASIGPGGMTNLSAGLLRGLQEVRRAAGAGPAAGSTLLLLSDGHANEGVSDPVQLEAVAARTGVVVGTIGIGEGYDDRLLSAVARGGRGDHVFALAPEEAAAAVASQVDGLLDKAVQAASLLVRPTGDVAGVTVHNDLPAVGTPDGVMVELGDLWSGEQRKLLLSLEVPAMATLGLAQVATLELRSVALPELVEQVITVPLSVNVVPGDEAAGRVPDPKVRTELRYQQAQEAKRRAADALDLGDAFAARAVLSSAAVAADADPLLGEEAEVLRALAAEVERGEGARASKRSRMESSDKSRKRGRGE